MDRAFWSLALEILIRFFVIVLEGKCVGVSILILEKRCAFFVNYHVIGASDAPNEGL